MVYYPYVGVGSMKPFVWVGGENPKIFSISILA